MTYKSGVWNKGANQTVEFFWFLQTKEKDNFVNEKQANHSREIKDHPTGSKHQHLSDASCIA